MNDRIEAIVAPGYAQGLDGRDVGALRAMKAEAAAIENSVSYYRRLAQGRIEILEAERERRVSGGSVSELIARLPQILGNEPTRPAAAQTRISDPDVDISGLEWGDGREHLVTDDSSLAALPVLADADLERVLTDLRAFEKELSGYRQRLHGVIDTVEREIATRAAADV